MSVTLRLLRLWILGTLVLGIPEVKGEESGQGRAAGASASPIASQLSQLREQERFRELIETIERAAELSDREGEIKKEISLKIQSLIQVKMEPFRESIRQEIRNRAEAYKNNQGFWQRMQSMTDREEQIRDITAALFPEDYIKHQIDGLLRAVNQSQEFQELYRGLLEQELVKIRGLIQDTLERQYPSHLVRETLAQELNPRLWQIPEIEVKSPEIHRDQIDIHLTYTQLGLEAFILKKVGEILVRRFGPGVIMEKLATNVARKVATSPFKYLGELGWVIDALLLLGGFGIDLYTYKDQVTDGIVKAMDEELDLVFKEIGAVSAHQLTDPFYAEFIQAFQEEIQRIKGALSAELRGRLAQLQSLDAEEFLKEYSPQDRNIYLGWLAEVYGYGCTGFTMRDKFTVILHFQDRDLLRELVQKYQDPFCRLAIAYKQLPQILDRLGKEVADLFLLPGRDPQFEISEAERFIKKYGQADESVRRGYFIARWLAPQFPIHEIRPAIVSLIGREESLLSALSRKDPALISGVFDFIRSEGEQAPASLRKYGAFLDTSQHLFYVLLEIGTGPFEELLKQGDPEEIDRFFKEFGREEGLKLVSGYSAGIVGAYLRYGHRGFDFWKCLHEDPSRLSAGYWRTAEWLLAHTSLVNCHPEYLSGIAPVVRSAQEGYLSRLPLGVGENTAISLAWGLHEFHRWTGLASGVLFLLILGGSFLILLLMPALMVHLLLRRKKPEPSGPRSPVIEVEPEEPLIVKGKRNFPLMIEDKKTDADDSDHLREH